VVLISIYLTKNQPQTDILPSPLYNNKKSVINPIGIFVNRTEFITFVAKFKKTQF